MHTPLHAKQIVLGVTGSIACYKAADLASKLTQAGALVDVVLTAAAEQFITPLTFRSVTGRPVFRDLWDEAGHVQHVRLGEAADLLVIAPATAHTIAKLAHGLADNLLCVTALAARCPLLIAPAMDGGMFAHPAVQANLAILQARGAQVLGPAHGRMASGLTGPGRLLEPNELLGAIRLALAGHGRLAGRRILVSTGPTREPLDPVRYLSNRSSGKQGLALAQAALDRGAQVTVIHGPIAEPLPYGARAVPVQTAVEMRDAVLAQIGHHDWLLMAAAVADFRPQTVAEHKIKKDPRSDAAPTVSLARNPDILQAVADWKRESGRAPVVVGFAAETQDVQRYGLDKLRRKGLDFIAINDVSSAVGGFEVDTNAVTLIGRDGATLEIPLGNKLEVAAQILDHVATRLAASQE